MVPLPSDTFAYLGSGIAAREEMIARGSYLDMYVASTCGEVHQATTTTIITFHYYLFEISLRIASGGDQEHALAGLSLPFLFSAWLTQKA